VDPAARALAKDVPRASVCQEDGCNIRGCVAITSLTFARKLMEHTLILALDCSTEESFEFQTAVTSVTRHDLPRSAPRELRAA
jgi:hypothetical protein